MSIESKVPRSPINPDAGTVKKQVPQPISKTVFPSRLSTPCRILLGLKNQYLNRLSIAFAINLINDFQIVDLANASVFIFL
jgi:hypothetical protein